MSCFLFRPSVIAAAFGATLFSPALSREPAAAPDPGRYPAVAPGPLEFAWSIGGEPVRLRSEPWFAGAVSSLTFRGVEYLDASDHGRLLQGAVSFEGAGECLNPTQAGASRDRPPRTTSRVLWAQVRPDSYATATHMAYWKRPREDCSLGALRRRAINTTTLSDVAYTQVLRPGYRGFENAVEHEVTVTTGSPRGSAVVEVLTAYTPPAFDTFHLSDPVRDRFTVDRTPATSPGEQPRPVILATADGSSAIGFVAPRGDPQPGYGRWTFPVTSKINLVQRPRGAYAVGGHTYRAVWAIGTLEEVKTTVRGVYLGERG